MQEGETWTQTAKSCGDQAWLDRSVKWSNWYDLQLAKISHLNNSAWAVHQQVMIRSRSASVSCPKSSGHVEKVRLPPFSGHYEYFAEFKLQFRELSG